MQKISEEIIDFIRELVSVKSQNGIDSEKLIARKVFDKLKSFGFSPEIIGSEKHPSVVCLIKKRDGAKTIWLESCLDTVKVGDILEWQTDPFEANIIGNKMFGRGVADSKAAIAIFCYLAKELSKDKNFNNSLFLGFDADEQSGVFTGVKDIMKIAPRSDVCVLGYQGDDEISIGARGWLRLRLTTFGKAAHTGSRSQKGINAIHIMSRIISEILSTKSSEKKERFFEFGSSLNFSQISGGVAINIVPDKCECDIDIRLTPSQNKAEIMKTIRDAIGKAKKEKPFRYKLEVLQYEKAYMTDSQNDFVRILSKNANTVLKKKIPITASGQGSVGNVLVAKKTPIINAFGCECGNVHAPNEWINIKSVPKIFEVYRKSLINF